jgi:uncharacterized membrane protein (GlpM family)
MAIELALRFLLGGAVVSLFSIAGEVLNPKTFSGMFGAAPSVAIASLAIAWAKHGTDYVATEGRSMLIGAVAFYVYGAACVATTKRERLPVWLGASVSWSAWAAVAFAILGLTRYVGLLR